MKSALTIGTLKNHCRFIGKVEDAAVVTSEIRQLSDSQLPSAIADEISRRLLFFLEQDGIYRIRRLHLDLAMTRRDLSARRLSALLATQLITALEKQLAGKSDDVVHFESEAEFFASLMAALLHGNQKDAWIYEDYAALRHLPPVDAAVQLLLPRLREIALLAAGLRRRDALATLLASLNERHADALLLEWSGIGPQWQIGEALIPAPDVLTDCQQWLAGVSPPAVDRGVALTVAIVRTLLMSLSVSAPPGNIAVVPWAVLHRVFLQRYSRQMSALICARRFSPDEKDALARFDVAVTPLAESLLAWMGTDQDRRRYIEHVLRQFPEADASSGISASVNAGNPRESTAGETVLFSRTAGLVLLIPVMISLRLHTCFSMATLRNALQHALSDDAVDEHVEPWLQVLLPDADSITAIDGELPEGWRHGISAQRQTQIEALGGDEQIAQLLLAAFAARLTGLQMSSPQYLRRQFLHCSGHFVVDDRQIVAQLDSIALAIVLQMAGLTGWSERIPWLERQLTIEIKS